MGNICSYFKLKLKKIPSISSELPSINNSNNDEKFVIKNVLPKINSCNKIETYSSSIII